MRKITLSIIGAITITISVVLMLLPGGNAVPDALTRPAAPPRPHVTHSPHATVRNTRPAVHAAASSLQVITVRPGDDLYKIAGRYLGSGSRWPNLWWSNRAIVRDPNQIRSGQRLDVWRWQKGPVPAAIEAAAERAMGPAAATVAATSPGAATSPPPPPAPLSGGGGSYQQYALSLFGQYGWDSGQMDCLRPLWDRESGWDPHASNQSGAYGIPQALPGDKMASAGPDWHDNGDTQIRWGEGYISGTYGTPCGAWNHELADGWY